MGLWKITDNRPTKVEITKFKQEKLLEEKIEEWISSDPLILGESLLIIGRQVMIPDTRDRIDLLALDPQGNAVIIELKRGKLKDPVDMQALRYASYISKWNFEDFENVAQNYFRKIGDPEFKFNALFESFCVDAGVDEIPDLNKEQRAIIVGSSVREKLGSVALWLFEHGIDIKVIEVHIYKDGNEFFIEPTTVIPLQVSKFADTGRIITDRVPWLTDGKTWHLEKRCSQKTKDLFINLDKLIQQNFDVDGPIWKQKFYVAFRVRNYNWLYVKTTSSALVLGFLVKAKSFENEDIANRLNISVFDKKESFAEKIGLPSSVTIENRNELTDRIYIRVKEDFDLESEQFLSFLKDAYNAFPK